MSRTWFKSGRVFSPSLDPSGEPAWVLVDNGKIVRVERDTPGVTSASSGEGKIFDLGTAWLLPGLVDSHVHLNEPGRTEWEGFETGTFAAAAGGITTLVDMPLNSDPVTTTAEALSLKRRATHAKLAVDLGYFGGIVPANSGGIRELEILRRLVETVGILGCKAFLCFSGIESFPAVGEADLRRAMPILKAAGIPLVVHAELECPLSQEVLDRFAGNPRSYQAYLASRPRNFENEAVRLLIRLTRETGCPVHVVHLSSSDVLPEIAAAKREGLAFSAETCPHYLHFAAEDIPDGRTEFKCAPPVRERENREKLWQGLSSGVLDFVVADHSPCTPALKLIEEGDFARAWGGIASLQLGMSVVTTGALARGFKFEKVLAW
ncbi:MAG: allantoinase AllB, partial [Bdellovibrionota bacterium]